MLRLITFIKLSSALYSSCHIFDCVTCSLRNHYFCNDCNSGFIRSLEGCSELSVPRPSPIENCESYNTDQSCIICKPGYDLISNSCEPICKKDCACFEPNTCVDLNYISSVKGKSERSLALCNDCDDCNTLNGYCITCSEGYYEEIGICYSCGITGCSRCLRHLTCYKCMEGYYYRSNDCVKCRANCKACSMYSICRECESGYKKESGKCVSDTSRSIIVVIIAPIFSVIVLIV